MKTVDITVAKTIIGWKYFIMGVSHEVSAEHFSYPIAAIRHAFSMIDDLENIKVNIKCIASKLMTSTK